MVYLRLYVYMFFSPFYLYIYVCDTRTYMYVRTLLFVNHFQYDFCVYF